MYITLPPKTIKKSILCKYFARKDMKDTFSAHLDSTIGLIMCFWQVLSHKHSVVVVQWSISQNMSSTHTGSRSQFHFPSFPICGNVNVCSHSTFPNFRWTKSFGGGLEQSFGSILSTILSYVEGRHFEIRVESADRGVFEHIPPLITNQSTPNYQISIHLNWSHSTSKIISRQ